jgi:Ice-binding-like
VVVIIIDNLKNTTMKTKNFLTISAILLVGLMSSCQKDDVTNVSSAVKSNALPSTINSVAMSDNVVQLQGQLTGVNFGVAGNFEILSETGITDVYKSTITGDVGSGPITGAAILLSCAEVAGTIYSVDVAGPLPCRITNASMLTIAVSDMLTAYNDATGRINPDFIELGAGNIGGKTLTPGLYKWSSSLIIPTDITISGGPNDVWIFQVAGTLLMSSAVKITLSGGAQAKNIYWVPAGAVTLGTTSHFEGNILGKTSISLMTGASINGRILAQTAVTLQTNTANMPQ